MTVKEAIEYIISKSKDDESLLTDTERFWAFLIDLAPEHQKELKVIKRSLDSDFLNLCFKDKEDIKRRVLKMKFRLEDLGLDKNWIDFIVDSFFTPLGWTPPKDEEETALVEEQQIQKQQTQNQQTQQTQNIKQDFFIAILIFVVICSFTIFSNSNNRDKNKPVTYSTIETANVGDYIKFGNYPQTADGQFKPIEWQVLSKEGNKMLVISRYGLEARRFNNSSNIWKNSEIRKWLNNDFYNKAFTDQEKKSINFSNLSDVGTSDNVFLLSKEEAEKYFANNDVRRCKATEYAVKNGARVYKRGYSYWWLRSPTNNSRYVFIINKVGLFSGVYFDYDKYLVRPAMWINLDNNNIKESVTYFTIETANVGDYIRFGNYPQIAGEFQPIEWQILAKKGNKILVISRYGLEARHFDSYLNNWKNSEICQWLNSDFYNKAFSENEKKNINIFHGDNVFLLSKKDAEKYFANDEARKCKPTEYAKNNGAYVADNGFSWWWLRSPFLGYVYVVDSFGYINYCHIVGSDVNLARPALWINL